MSWYKRVFCHFINFIYKWLPIVCGCHCRSDRSFFFRGYQFPICARCTGEVIGVSAGIIFFIFCRLSVPVLVCMLVPALIDGVVQMKTDYESNNIRRLWTGILLGFGTVNLMLQSFLFAFRFGEGIGMQLKGMR